MASLQITYDREAGISVVEKGKMSETQLLLNAYYEALYERLEAKKDLVVTRIEKMLRQEIQKREFGKFGKEKYAAYREASLAFVEERLETYNPIGIQYTFDRIRAREAFEYTVRVETASLGEAAGGTAILRYYSAEKRSSG